MRILSRYLQHVLVTLKPRIKKIQVGLEHKKTKAREAIKTVKVMTWVGVNQVSVDHVFLSLAGFSILQS